MVIGEKEVAAALAQFTREPEDEGQARKRRRILQAATEQIVRFGYRKTSVDDVARAAGVAKGTVYLYFKNKADLLVHAIAEEKLHYLSHMKSVFDPDRSPVDRLKAWIRTVLVVARQMPLAGRLLRGDREIELVMEEIDVDFRSQRESMEKAFVSQLIDAAAAPHDWSQQELEERTVILLNQVYSGLLNQNLVSHDMSVDRYADLLTRTLVDGVINEGEVA